MYNKEDMNLIEKLTALGLDVYTIQRLINVANMKRISIQKAYRLTEANVFNVDLILIVIVIFFVASIGLSNIKDLLALALIFGLVFVVIEITCRFHKGFWRMLKCYIRLRGI
ncbi:hypothetical protein [Pseudocitrobacter vendiensis]|uniref:Uncharacterized protein n=1 Tax=Pseudocitrobacter vendiensis TaxID=2488306 RepID=A0ABN8TAL4_9ENTR|nr:hypothetical protein [Pseudocitrobacter vendiensis]CAH6659816.1 hypothetical protein FBBNIHIM_11875 [Pseudocitrobacter vendiensis]